jgi:hypothetical protein
MVNSGKMPTTWFEINKPLIININWFENLPLLGTLKNGKTPEVIPPTFFVLSIQ